MNSIYKTKYPGRHIWMYWPGENAYQFKENAEEGFMACGLNKDREVGDLDEVMKERGGLEAALRKAYGAGRRIANGKKLLKWFANEMRIGDFVIARQGVDHIVGVGIVTGDYEYRASRPRFRHCRNVKWIDTQRRPFPDAMKQGVKWNRVTLIDKRHRELAEQIISGIYEGK